MTNWNCAEIIQGIRGNKWLQRYFIISIGLLLGVILTLLNPSTPIGMGGFFAIASLSIIYLLLVYLEGHARIVRSALGKNTKIVVGNKVYTIWMTLLHNP
jgi:hypothetical protein